MQKVFDFIPFLFLSRRSIPQMSQCWMKRSCLCICSPKGRCLLPRLKSSKQPPFTAQKTWICCLQLRYPPHSLCGFGKLLHLLLCNSFYKAPAVHAPAQQCSSIASGRDPAPLPQSWTLFPSQLTITPHAGIHPPTPSLGEMVGQIGCCAVKNQPLMGSGGERQCKGGGRRIQLKKYDITCAASKQASEREKEWEVAQKKWEQARGNCIRWIGCWADVDERERDGKKGNVNEERVGASLLIT